MNVDLLDLATKPSQRRQSKFSMKRHDVQLLTLLAYRTLQSEGEIQRAYRASKVLAILQEAHQVVLERMR